MKKQLADSQDLLTATQAKATTERDELLATHNRVVAALEKKEQKTRTALTMTIERHNDIVGQLNRANADIRQRHREAERLRGLFGNVRRAVTGVAEVLLDQASSFGEIDGDTTASGCSAAALAALRVRPDAQQQQGGGGGSQSTGQGNKDGGGESSKGGQADQSSKGGKADQSSKGGDGGSSSGKKPGAEATGKNTRSSRRDSSVPGK